VLEWEEKTTLGHHGLETARLCYAMTGSPWDVPLDDTNSAAEHKVLHGQYAASSRRQGTF